MIEIIYRRFPPPTFKFYWADIYCVWITDISFSLSSFWVEGADEGGGGRMGGEGVNLFWKEGEGGRRGGTWRKFLHNFHGNSSVEIEWKLAQSADWLIESFPG